MNHRSNPQRGSFRSRWRTEVIQTNLVPDSVKLLLLVMCDHSMDERGYVSIPRAELSEMLQRHPSRVSERLDTAIKAGLLSVVRRGYLGHTAEYRACRPDLNGYRETVTIAETPKIGKHATPEWLPDGQ